MKKFLVLSGLLAMLVPVPGMAEGLSSAVKADYPYVSDLYEYFHANPELSLKEKNSSERIATELKELGFNVTTGVGDRWVRAKVKKTEGSVPEGVGGYGVVGVYENGDGPTIMIRADMDALPLEEKTSVSYASKVRSTDYKGQDAPVMHACAHDSHMASMIGTARLLVEMKDQWTGTLVMVGQPAEEIGLGALAMLDDGLYKKFPKPDAVLALHTTGWQPAGVVAYTPGYALANVDSVDIYVKGIGAHGSTPHLGKDPIVVASSIVTALQTLVSRELDAQEAGVVTVGSFQAGYKHNIIPDAAHLQITVRSYSDEVREQLLSGIKRIARAQALSAGLPEELMPVVEIEQDYTPSTYNDPDLTAKAVTAIKAAIGSERVTQIRAVMGGEDFSQFSRTDDEIPALIFWVGAADPDAIRTGLAGETAMPPSNHSPFFAPIKEPTLLAGVESMTAAAISLLQK